MQSKWLRVNRIIKNRTFCKQMTDIKFLLLYSNTWNCVQIQCQKKLWLISKCNQQNVYKSCVFNIYV